MEEKVFKVDINAKGLAWYEYYGHLDIDEAIEAIKSRIQAALSSLGDVDISTVDIEVS